jgi:MFS family permease
MVVASVGDMFPERQGLALAVTGFIGTMGVAVGGLIAAIGSLDSLRLPFIAVACLFLASTLLVKKLPID